MTDPKPTQGSAQDGRDSEAREALQRKHGTLATVEDAAAHIERKAEAHADDLGYGVGGTLCFGRQEEMDHYTTLTELAEELRILARPAPEALPVPAPTHVDTTPMYKALIEARLALAAVNSGASIKALSLIDGVLNVAPEALGAAQTWQPIETAPKDGTEILLYAPPTMYEGSSVSERVTAGKWHEWVETSAEYHATTGEYLGRYEQDSGAFWLSWDGGFTEEYPPTHWMPLPTPPATTAKDQS